MSGKIKLNAASGGGSVSLQAPSSSSNTRVLTLPDSADGTVARTSDVKIVSYAIIADQKSSGTHGGAFTSGAWRTRDLNTEVTDVDNIVSLSSNRFTLQAGTYLIIARAPAHDCNSHQTRLRNITDGSTVRFGMNSFLDSRYQGNTNALLIARTTITGAKEFELQHQAESDKTNGGFGVAANFTTEVYTEIEIYKEG
jgi:hypothetical protein|tara:strand:- start:45 stop:635 length:591 start_codon:yes stop_codon:yes gene_type:complete